jgi:hypothetical protein
VLLPPFFVGIEVERNPIDAIAQALRIWAVGKDMAEVRVALRAAYLGAAYKPGAVLVLAYGVFARGCVEARPASSGIVFRIGREQRRAAADAAIHALELLAPFRLRFGNGSGFRGLSGFAHLGVIPNLLDDANIAMKRGLSQGGRAIVTQA